MCFSEKIKSLISENAAFEKEQTRLIEIQAKLIIDSKKREQELRKQVTISCRIQILFRQRFLLVSNGDRKEREQLDKTNQ